jgi:hypothetical protein
MFDEICSVYKEATDAEGRFVDYETGECIQQMTIREFCLTDRWKPYVQHLRAMRKEFGSKAKKMQEYIDTKKHLPGATLSGLFALYEDDSLTHPGQRVMVSRRETHLKQHTGWLAIDIDLSDNTQMSNFENVRMICRFRPEIALLMRSCSGSGYFGLVKLAYPERHKDQFKALLKDYAAIGITLDKACSNIGRVRFASWDDPEHIYINEKVVPYKGLEGEQVQLVSLASRQAYRSHAANVDYQVESDSNFWCQQRVQDRLVEVIVQELVSNQKNITESYDDWVKAGWALRSHPYGLELFHQLSRCSSKYNEAQTNLKWQQLGNSKTVTYNYLIHACKVALGEETYRQICRRVWSELKEQK